MKIPIQTSAYGGVTFGTFFQLPTFKNCKTITVDPHYFGIPYLPTHYHLFVTSIKLAVLLCSFVDMYRAAKIWVAQHTHFQLRPNNTTLPSCFSSHTVNKCAFCRLLISAFLCLLLVILLFEMSPKHSTKVSFTVPKCKKAMMCLWRKYLVSLLW